MLYHKKRCFWTSNHSRINKIEDNSSKSSRKTLKSPQSRPYKDLYKEEETLNMNQTNIICPPDEKVPTTSVPSSKSLPEPQVP